MTAREPVVPKPPIRPTDQDIRACAIPVYRALVAAGAVGLSRTELRTFVPAETGIELEAILLWMRMTGVDIRFLVPFHGEPGRFVLAARLPETWESTLHLGTRQ